MKKLILITMVAILVFSPLSIQKAEALHFVPILMSAASVSVNLTPQSYEFSVKADFSLTTIEDVIEFELELDPSYSITSLTFDGKTVPSYFSYGIIDIFMAAKKDETHKVHIEYDGYAPGDPRKMNPVYVGSDMAHLIYGWMPEIPEQNYWLPDNTTLTINAPKEWQTYCIGKKIKSGEGWGTYKLDYKSQFLTCGAGPYKVSEGTYGNIPISVYFLPNHSQLGGTYVDEIKYIIEHHEAYFGSYQQTRYQLVEANDFIGGGIGPAGMSLIYSSSLNQPLEGRQRLLVAHELGHSWTPGAMLVPMGVDNSAVFTTECLVSYIAYMYIEEVEGRYSMIEMMTQDIGHYFSYIDRNGDTPLLYLTNANADIRTQIAYNKGPWIYHMLRYFLGETDFKKLISDFMEEYRGYRTNANDFWLYSIDNYSEVIPPNFFIDWLARAAHFDVWLSDIKSTKNSDGTYKNDLTFGARGGATWVDINVDCYYKTGDDKYDKKRITINDYEATVNTPSPVTDVTIDPDTWFPSRSNLPPTGPLSDCINRGRYSIVVYGTQGEDKSHILVSKYWARLFYRYLQSTNSYGVDLIADTEVSQDHMINADVYLFGDASVNKITALLGDCLPVKFGEANFSVGGQTFSSPDQGIICCYADSCFNPSKYVTIFAGNSASALDGCLMVNFENMDSDYVVFNELSKDARRDSYLGKGVFAKPEGVWDQTALPALNIGSIAPQAGNIYKINGTAPGAKYIRVGDEAIHVEADGSFKGMFELDESELTVNIEAYADDFCSIHYNFNRFLLSPEIAINLKVQSSQVIVNTIDVSDYMRQPVKLVYKSPFVSVTDMSTLLWMSGGTCSTFGDGDNTYITLSYGDKRLLLTEGQSVAFADGQPVPIDKTNTMIAPAFFGELYIPVSVLSLLGAKFNYNPKNGDIWIKFKTGAQSSSKPVVPSAMLVKAN